MKQVTFINFDTECLMAVDRFAIEYALFSPSLSDTANDCSVSDSIKIPPADYVHAQMKGKIWCPECSQPLTRSPLVGSRSKGEVEAYYKHKVSGDAELCGLIGRRGGSGRGYLPGDVISIDFSGGVSLDGKGDPKARGGKRHKGDGGGGSVEDGRTPRVPIVRELSSICKKLDVNLTKFVNFNDDTEPQRLRDLIKTKNNIDNTSSGYDIYVGKVTEFEELSYKYCIKFEGYGGLYLYADNSVVNKSRLPSRGVGSYLMIYSEVDSRSQLHVDQAKFFACIPPAYNHCIEDLDA
ncbi:hypothetical protein [Pseudoteredinibacter isoporae]|uniref:hypothetical protein n=1 Tax=Pseudoteredinibacter isoporae TaxID=570281 RepID=UPI0031043C41